MEGCLSKHMKDTIKDTVVLLSMFSSKNEQLERRLYLHTAVVLISLLWTERKDCSGWASLHMSFKTPMLSYCSIFIHLQVSNRPLGQHPVSLPVSSAVDGTCVVDRDNTTAPTKSPSPLLSSSLPNLATGCVYNSSYIPLIAALFSLA